jgi:hypothetical protein
VTADGLHLVAYVGDADGNGSYSSSDAVLITRVALQSDSGFAAFPLVDPVIVADIDGSGFLPADAALQVNEAGVGYPTANLPSPPIPGGVVFQRTPARAIVTPSVPSSASIAPASVRQPSDEWFQALDRGMASTTDLLQVDLLRILEEAAGRRVPRPERLNRRHAL